MTRFRRGQHAVWNAERLFDDDPPAGTPCIVMEPEALKDLTACALVEVRFQDGSRGLAEPDELAAA